MKEVIDDVSHGIVRITIDKGIYDSHTVLKTAYIFNELCYITIDGTNTEFVVSFKLKESVINRPLRTIVDDFLNELTDQQVRAIVQTECAQIRTEIVKKAFSPIN
jgi:His-Xaa-Ser system protein HxsD